MINFLKSHKTAISFLVVFLFLNLLISLIIFSKPGYPTYPLKKTWGKIMVAIAPNDLEKAAIHLSSSDNLLQDFTLAWRNNPNDKRLLPIANELLYEEDQAIFHMTKAKDSRTSVKKEAGILCEILEKQHEILRLTETKSPDEIKKYLQIAQSSTNLNLKKSMSWE